MSNRFVKTLLEKDDDVYPVSTISIVRRIVALVPQRDFVARPRVP